MPWKGEKNPYYIWLSEIILQQTRVEQGLPYFQRFKKRFPTVKQLAKAKEDEVMRLWQGLGYYSRARNLHETAKNIHNNYKGKFPNTFSELIKLKGIGDYTAAAIASFAFGEKKAVIDGNVIRVLSRVFGVEPAFDTSAGKRQFVQLAQKLIDEKQPGIYNQAIMDFGSLVCLPKKPKCTECPFSKFCFARQKNKTTELPSRKAKTKIKRRYFNYFVIKSGKEILISKRTSNDIWKNLYELPLIETANFRVKNFPEIIFQFLGVKSLPYFFVSNETVQLLSHRRIHFRFVEVDLKDFTSPVLGKYKRVKRKELSQFAFPKTIHLYLKKKFLL